MDDGINASPSDGVIIARFDDRARMYLAVGEQTGGRLYVGEFTVPPSRGARLHVHKSADEAFYVLEGKPTFRVGSRAIEGAGGTFIFIPRGTCHSFRNLSDRPARVLVIYTPAGMEHFFKEQEQLLGAGSLDEPTLRALYLKHDMELPASE